MNHPWNPPPEDGTDIRRKRKRVRLGGSIALENGAIADADVLDLSHDGCGIETLMPLEVGRTIKLSIPGRGAIEADVRWSSDGRAGLVFKAEPDPPRPHRPRKNARRSLSANARLRRIGGANYLVRVSDLSPDGCKVELIDRPRQGELMFIKFEGLEVLEAEVCWIRGSSGGLRFATPLHPAVLDMLVARLK